MSKATTQKGAASSTPSALKRWVLSRYLTHIISDDTMRRKRSKLEAKRQKEGRKHVVEYYHQVDDGYSHLAIQLLSKLRAQYDIDLEVYLVPALRDDNFPEPELLQEMSRWDSANIAPQYNLDFPSTDKLPLEKLTRKALAILARLSTDQFATVGVDISKALWRQDEDRLNTLSVEHGSASENEVRAKLDVGAERRAKLQHYSGAMFYYEDEWYWGVDRLCHLEDRLQALGLAKNVYAPTIAPRPTVSCRLAKSAKHLTLEYFPSLRSPYSAISWEPTMRLAKDTGINLVVRPVLPMVMRGVPATFTKGFYVWKDVAREARKLGVEYGKFYDPIGEPVKQGYSIYMWALGQNKGNDFLEAFLKAAFAKGINTNSRSGMRKVVELAGLDWEQAKHHLEDDTWQDIMEENRKGMYRFGSWGVPSYRLLDRDGKELLGVWGQDRLWLVSRKIEEFA